ncbi:uncharacterized protein LOC120539520 isoform X1 [Polypterus senegalus]|uniref:uncharacterized protein LOC120539520 isoform X1 n=1 Tax=Polypterus senegalus TaxID=55291 RepID=UPI00196429E3|nr:uncharacterized protein LOC120539520 isoform X1 [Polypterus senegalus]
MMHIFITLFLYTMTPIYMTSSVPVKAEVKILTTEIQKTESIMIKCQGDQAVKGFCYFYKNEALFFSEVYITEEKACVMTLFGYQLLDQRTIKSVTQVNVSCEIKVIGNDDKWTSRRSRKLTLNINENLNRPALSATSHITRKDAAITLTCELPQTFPEAHCHFYRDDDLHPFKSKSSEDNKCELSVNGHELLGGRTAGMETESQVRCDYTLNMSLEIHSQYSNYTSIIVLVNQKPEVYIQESKMSVLCKAPFNVTDVLFHLYQEGKEESIESKMAEKNESFVIFEIERHEGEISMRYWCQYEYKGVKSPKSDLIGAGGEYEFDISIIAYL